MRKIHIWGAPLCVRLKRRRDFNGEAHPCYWCGYSMPIDNMAITCGLCRGIVCSSCQKCMCNVADAPFDALRLLRHKYCCNLFYFRRGLQKKDRYYLELVPNFETALDYCRCLEGFR